MAALPSPPRPCAVHQRSFADQRHTLFYAASPSQAAGAASPQGRRRTTPVASAAHASTSPSVGFSSRRARLMQQVASVEETLRRLEEQAGPLAPAEAALGAQAYAPRRPAHAMRSLDDSSSSSSSESEAEGPARGAASRVGRRLHLELVARRDASAAAAANIVPGPGLSATPHAAAPAAPPAAATAVRVCTGKKCSAGGAAGVLAALGSMNGVAAAAAPKCMGQCKRCVAVKMASPAVAGGAEVLYTGVNASNAAGVLAMHQAQQAQHAALH